LYKPFQLEPDYINVEISRNKSLQLTRGDQTFSPHKEAIGSLNHFV